ncbi:MAG: hypothetical protein KC912_05900 [Proteobacteria bacterium]|nr:hypothetical protein [Pseudomonadota bacterium]
MRWCLPLLLVACTADEAMDDSDDVGVLPATLTLVETLDTNAVVATKGLDVAPNGHVLLWNYNQDTLERWDGSALTAVVSGGLVSGYGTDVAVDSHGAVYVSKGGDTTGEVIMKWDGTSGDALWTDGVTLTGGLLLGLDTAVVNGEERLYVADGATSQVHALSLADGAVMHSIDLVDVPLDIAVTPDEQIFALTADSSSPVVDNGPVMLRKFDASGTEIAPAVLVRAGSYLTLGDGGLVYVSTTDFDQPTRAIAAFSPDLVDRVDTALPVAYAGFAGGIATGPSGRIHILAQEGTGSGPICDVLVYE